MAYIFLIALLITSTVIQVIYYLIYITAFSKKNSGNSTPQPVSVIIAAHNEEANLRRLLPLLYQQNHPDFEIVVIDDRSYDDSYDFLLEEATREPRLKVVKVNEKPESFNGKKYALTLGIKAAKKENLVFTDADCTPANDLWLQEMSSGLTNNEINLGFSYYEKRQGVLNTFIRFETIWTAIQYMGLALVGAPYMGVGRNLGYKKSLFINNKGFSGHLSVTGGDDDLFVNKHAKKANTAVTTGADSITYSIPKTTFSAYIRQKLRHIYVGKHYKSSNKVILGLFSLSHIFFWLILALLIVMQMQPYILLTCFIIKTLLVYITFILACKKLGIKFTFWSLLLLDFIFDAFYIYIGIRALFTKSVRWS